MTKITDTATIVRTAFSSLANVMTDLHTKTTEAGAQERVNRMAFTQKAVLNGICYSIDRNIESTVVRHSKARDELKAALDAEDGGEISANVIQRKMQWLSNLDDQLNLLELLMAEASAVHEAATGTPYVRPAKPIPGATDKTSLRAEAQRALAAAARTR